MEEEEEENWGDDDLIAARLIVNIHVLVAHDNFDGISRKTGIEHERLREILTLAAYPDGYEIALFQHAYGRDIWPGTDTDPTGS